MAALCELGVSMIEALIGLSGVIIGVLATGLKIGLSLKRPQDKESSI
jgi:hypothetical protein